MNYTRAVSVSRFILVILCIALVLSIALCGIDSGAWAAFLNPVPSGWGWTCRAVRSSPTAPNTEDTGETRKRA